MKKETYRIIKNMFICNKTVIATGLSKEVAKRLALSYTLQDDVYTDYYIEKELI